MNYQMWNIIFSPFKIDWSLRFFQPTIYFSIFFLSELKEEEEEKGKEEKKEEEEEKLKKKEREREKLLEHRIKVWL